jgi:acyl-CoA thioester hydrolase
VVGRPHETTVRVRYGEVDRMGFVHHSRYLDYFEQARTEHLRSLGRTYREVEDSGCLLVVHSVEARYYRPARYDDLLTVRSVLAEASGARLVFDYEVERDGARIATGKTTLASTDRTGRPIRVPEDLRRLFRAAGADAGVAEDERKRGAASGVQGRS